MDIPGKMHRLTIILAIMILAVVSAAVMPSSSVAKSYFVNGDFEEGKGEDVSGWSRTFYPKHDADINACISRSDSMAKSGSWSLKIDTGSILGEEVTLVFNDRVSQEAMGLRGQQLDLSGWVYVKPGTALRPIGMRLRTFGPDAEGKNAFLKDVLSVQVLGKPGEWVSFRASGTLPDAVITSMDLHCSIRPDEVQTVQFLDDLRLEAFVQPPLEVSPLRDAIWRDEKILPVEVKISGEMRKAKTLAFRLMNAQGDSAAEWSRPPKSVIVGLPLPESVLPEGRYLLRADLVDGNGNTLSSTEAPINISASPWENAPESRSETTDKGRTDGIPDAFQAAGTVAPTNAAEVVPESSEMISPDADLSEWHERGYAVFSRHYLDPVSRLGRPRPGESESVRLFASAGEYEPATVSVWALKGQKAVSMTVTDLKGENGTILASNVDVRTVRTVKGLPSFLEKREATDIPEGQTQTFWLTVHIPSGTAPGFYRGNIEVSPKSGKASKLGMLVRVLPLELPPPQKGYGFWWKMDARWNGYYSKTREVALEQIRKQFVLLREYGCNMVSCYGMPKMTRGEDGTIAFDFEQDHWGHDAYSLADYFRLGRETGFLSAKVPIQYAGADSLHSSWIARAVELDPESPAFDDFYRNACQRLALWAKAQGYELAFACIDEIGNSEERRQDALRFYRIAKEAGVLTSVTDNSMHGGTHLMGQSRFDDIIDMRLYNFITPEMIQDTRQSGDRLWLYNMASGGWNAKRDRFAFGLFTERCGAEGFSQWAFQWPSSNADPYETAEAGNRSGYHYILPAPDGPLPTLALEGVREGIDDARYLALLKNLSTETYLDDIEPFSPRIGDYLDSHSGSFFDVRRWRMAREAMKAKSGL